MKTMSDKELKDLKTNLVRTRIAVRKTSRLRSQQHRMAMLAIDNLDDLLENVRYRIGRRKGLGCPGIVKDEYGEYSCPVKKRKQQMVRYCKRELYVMDCSTCHLTREEALRGAAFQRIMDNKQEEVE